MSDMLKSASEEIGLALRFVDEPQKRQPTIGDMISKTQPIAELPSDLQGHIWLGNLTFQDLPARKLHDIAMYRNMQVVELAKEYASLVGGQGDFFTDAASYAAFVAKRPKLDEEMSSEKHSEHLKPYTADLGQWLKISEASSEFTRFKPNSFIIAFCIPPLPMYLRHYEGKDTSSFRYQSATDDEYARWQHFILSHNTLATKHLSKELKAYFPLTALRSHGYIVGGSGSGKSELIKLLCHSVICTLGKGKRPDAISGLIIDPHGDLSEQIARFQECESNERVILFDPTASEFSTPSIDIFSPPDSDETSIAISADNLTTAFSEIIGDAAMSVQMEALLKPCLGVLLRRPNSSLHDLQRFMQEEGNDDLIELGKSSPYHAHAQFFTHGFHEKNFAPTKRAIYTRIQSLLNAPIFGRLVNPKAAFNLEKELNAGKFVVMNLSRGGIGADVSSAFGRLVVALVKNMGLRRQSIPEKQRPSTFVFIDECQNYLGDGMKEILTEARKYGIHLILANQVIGQDMSKQLERIILENTAVKFVGRTGHHTRSIMAREMTVSGEVLEGLSVGRFCSRITSGVKTLQAFTIQTPTHLLGNANSMSSEAWYAQKKRSWSCYIPNNVLDSFEPEKPTESPRASQAPKGEQIEPPEDDSPRFEL